MSWHQYRGIGSPIYRTMHVLQYCRALFGIHICTDYSLFAKCFLANSFYQYGSPPALLSSLMNKLASATDKKLWVFQPGMH